MATGREEFPVRNGPATTAPETLRERRTAHCELLPAEASLVPRGPMLSEAATHHDFAFDKAWRPVLLPDAELPVLDSRRAPGTRARWLCDLHVSRRGPACDRAIRFRAGTDAQRSGVTSCPAGRAAPYIFVTMNVKSCVCDCVTEVVTITLPPLSIVMSCAWVSVTVWE